MTDTQKSYAGIVADLVSAFTIASLLWPGRWHLDLLSQHPNELEKIVEALAGLIAGIRLYVAKPHPIIEVPLAHVKSWILSHFTRTVQP